MDLKLQEEEVEEKLKSLVVLGKKRSGNDFMK